MAPKLDAERGGADRAEDHRDDGIRAVALYGPTGSWRARHVALYRSDASLRWDVQTHRAELDRAGALGMFRGRLFAFEPVFSRTIAAIARRRAAGNGEALLAAAQAAADCAVTEAEALAAASATA